MKKIAIILIVFSVFLRFYFFWDPSFSSDEAHYTMSAVRVLNGVKGVILRQNIESALKNLSLPFFQAAHGPAEFLVIIPAAFFHPREFFVRFVFVILSIISLVYCFYQLKKMRNRWIALFFLLFVGTSKYAVLWSQTAMYQTLSISVVSLILVGMISFEKNPKGRGLIFLGVLSALGLLVFPDLILYCLAVFWLVFEKRKQINQKDLVKSLAIFLVVAGIFYVPWVLYGFFGNDPGSGFRFLISHKLSAMPNPLENFSSFLSNFFLYPGVVVMLPFSFLSTFMIKKAPYLKYVWLTVVAGTIIYVFKSYIPYFYFVSLFSAIALFASEGIMIFKNNFAKKILFSGVLIVNVIGLIPLLNKNYNTFVMLGRKKDEIKKVGKFINKCGISNDETYLSTVDFGRAEYYFGRQSTLYQDGQENRIKLMEDFVKGGYENVKYIHYVKGELNQKLETHLNKKSNKRIVMNNDILLLFKKCNN